MSKKFLFSVLATIAAVLIAGNAYAQGERLRVMILDFETESGVSQAEATAMTNILTVFLQENFEVVYADYVNQKINELGFDPNTLTEQQMDVVDSLLNLHIIVTGTINLVSNRRFVTNAFLFNAQTSEMEATFVEAGEVFHQVAQRLGTAISSEMNQLQALRATDVALATPYQLMRHGDGVVINGVRWATRNVDQTGHFAASPEEAGRFYHWNSRSPWLSMNSRSQAMTGSDGVWIRENPCPQGWRVPTLAEMESLNAAGSVWTRVNDVPGRLFGTAPYQIFLPAAGGGGIEYELEHIPTHVSQEGIFGFYWTQMRAGSSAWRLMFSMTGSFVSVEPNPLTMQFGFSLRCVAIE